MTINLWGSELPVDVSHGGTGHSLLTPNVPLVGNGTSALELPDPALDGELLVAATSSPPSFAPLNGVTNQVVTTPGPGSLEVGFADNAILPGGGAMTLPTGLTAQRPTGQNAMVRYNSTLGYFERWEQGAWRRLLAGSTPRYLFVETRNLSGSASYDVTYPVALLPPRYIILLHNWNSTSATNLTFQYLNGAVPYTTNYRSTLMRMNGSTISRSTSTSQVLLASNISGSTRGITGQWQANGTSGYIRANGTNGGNFSSYWANTTPLINITGVRLASSATFACSLSFYRWTSA